MFIPQYSLKPVCLLFDSKFREGVSVAYFQESLDGKIRSHAV